MRLLDLNQNTMYKASSDTDQHFIEFRGVTPWRGFRCECGHVLYKKELPTSKYEILTGYEKGKGHKYTSFTPMRGTKSMNIECSFCSANHVVMDL
jgi:hypothetical protein